MILFDSSKLFGPLRLRRNPMMVVLTDRHDLDDQLFGQFQRCVDTAVKIADKICNLRDILASPPAS